MRDLEWENQVVLGLVQSLIGAMSCNIKAVAVETLRDRSIRLYFALREESEKDREELSDVPGYLADALRDGDLQIEADVWIGDDWIEGGWPGIAKRRVFATRD